MSRLNIRWKLLVVFMALFTVAAAGVFVWFYRYSTSMVMDYLRQSLMASASTAASLIDADVHTQVFTSGLEEDAQYTHIADQLRLVRDANPKVAAIYTMVRSPNLDELLFVVSADEDPETRAHLRYPYDVSEMPEMIAGFDGPSADEEMGADEFGAWLSGYAPIRDVNGQGIAIVGVDMEAEDVLRVQNEIKIISVFVFIIALIAVFTAVYLISNAITKPLREITAAAQSLEEGEAYEPTRLDEVGKGKDEISQLARVFDRMAEQVQARERKLKQQVDQLRIEVDEARRTLQVAEITDTDYFQKIQAMAKEMRNKR